MSGELRFGPLGWDSGQVDGDEASVAPRVRRREATGPWWPCRCPSRRGSRPGASQPASASSWASAWPSAGSSPTTSGAPDARPRRATLTRQQRGRRSPPARTRPRGSGTISAAPARSTSTAPRPSASIAAVGTGGRQVRAFSATAVASSAGSARWIRHRSNGAAPSRGIAAAAPRASSTVQPSARPSRATRAERAASVSTSNNRLDIRECASSARKQRLSARRVARSATLFGNSRDSGRRPRPARGSVVATRAD